VEELKAAVTQEADQEDQESADEAA